MRKAILLVVLAIVSAGRCTAAPSERITFTGEVSENQTFRRSIGHGLELELQPTDMDPGNITGWTIGVAPAERPSDPECADYVWVATPPYHFQNARYLDTSYGTTAQAAVRMSPREFNFVLNCADYHTESARVDQALYSPSETEKNDAIANLGTSPAGKGKLWIEKYRITPGRESESNDDLGAILCIWFRVEIVFPPDSAAPKKP